MGAWLVWSAKGSVPAAGPSAGRIHRRPMRSPRGPGSVLVWRAGPRTSRSPRPHLALFGQVIAVGALLAEALSLHPRRLTLTDIIDATHRLGYQLGRLVGLLCMPVFTIRIALDSSPTIAALLGAAIFEVLLVPVVSDLREEATNGGRRRRLFRE